MADIGKIKVGTTTYDINAYKLLSGSANSTKYLAINDASTGGGIRLLPNVQGDSLEIFPQGDIRLIAGQTNCIKMASATADVSNVVELNTGGLTAVRQVTFPDKSGTIAMTTDLGDQVTFSLSNGVLTITPKS